MRLLNTILFLAFGLFVNAQYVTPNTLSDDELHNYIENDFQLYMDYKEAENQLKSAKTMGVVTVGLLVVDFMLYSAVTNSESLLEGPAYAGMFFVSSLTTCVVGTIALIKNSNAKSKMENVENIARYQMQKSSSLDLKISTNGLGLVYSF